MRISDWSSDVCSSDLDVDRRRSARAHLEVGDAGGDRLAECVLLLAGGVPRDLRVERGTLAEGRERDLRPAVFEDVAPGLAPPQSSEARRVGKECVRPCSSRCSPYNSQKKQEKH